MAQTWSPHEQAVRDTKRPCIRQIEGAVGLVATAAARRVVLINLDEPFDLLTSAQAIGRRSGVSVRLDRSATGDALIVEQGALIPDRARAVPIGIQTERIGWVFQALRRCCARAAGS